MTARFSGLVATLVFLMAASSCALFPPLASEKPPLDGTYVVRLYEDDRWPPQTVTLSLSFGANGIVTGSWSDGTLRGDGLRGTYTGRSRFVVLHFGLPDRGHSLWGIVDVNPLGDPNAYTMAGHWDRSGIAGSDRRGAFHGRRQVESP